MQINTFPDNMINALRNFIDKRSYRILSVFTYALLLFVLAVKIYSIFIPVPDLFGVENNVAFALQRFLAGFPLYADPESPPYAITQYSPLYYYVTFAFGKLFQVDPDHVYRVYLLNRTCSFFFNLIYAAIVYITARHAFNLKARLSLSIAIISLATLYPVNARPDSLYNCLFLLAFYVSFLFVKHRTEKKSNYLLPILCFLIVATVFAKQSGILIIAILLFLLLFVLNDFKRAAISFGYLSVLIFLFSWIFSNHDWHSFYLNVIQGLNNGISMGWFHEVILFDYFFTPWGLLINSVGLYASFQLLTDDDINKKVLGYGIIASFLFALFTALKYGSTKVYFIEFWALAMIGFFVMDKKVILPNLIPLFIIPVIYLKIAVSPHVVNIWQNRGKLDFSGYRAEKEVSEFVKERLSTEDEGFVYFYGNISKHFIDNFLYEYTIQPSKSIVIYSSYPLRVYDLSDYYKRVANKEVKYIISTQTKESFKFAGANFPGYEAIDSINGFHIYQVKQ